MTATQTPNAKMPVPRPCPTARRRRRLAGPALALMMAASAPAAEYTATVSRAETAFTVHNPFPHDLVPTLHITGVADGWPDNARVTEAPALNGCQLAGRLLTGSRLTLNPNGTGIWTYDGGFNGFLPGVALDQAPHPEEYFKHRWDTLGENAQSYRHPAHRLFLKVSRGHPVTYPIEFPSGMTITAVRLTAGFRRLESAGRLEIVLSRDPEGRDIVGRYMATPDGTEPAPASPGFRFADVESCRAYLSLSVERDWALVGPLALTAWLDTTGIALPVLKPGTNSLTYTDGSQSSHRAEILVSLPEVPERDLSLSTFEDGTDNWEPSEQSGLRWSEGAPGGAAQGKGYLSITLRPQSDGQGGVREASAMLAKLPQSDWSEYNRLEFAINAPGSPEGRLRIGFYSRPEGYSTLMWITEGIGDAWQRHSLDISAMGRKNVRWIKLSTYGLNWSGQKPFRLQLDDLRLARRPEAGAGTAPAAPVPGALAPGQALKLKAALTRWLAVTPPADEDAAPAEKTFPMGVWGLGNHPRAVAEAVGLNGWDGFKAVLNDLRAHNMNAIAGSGHPFHQDGGRYFDLIEAAGIRTWLYGPRYFHDQGSAEKNRAWFESSIAPEARRLAPVARGRRGLLAWGLTEEIPARMVPDLKPYYDLMAEIAPEASVVVLHNHLAPQKKQAEIFPATRVLAWDRYPFRPFWADPLKTWAEGIREHYRVARSINANLWVVMQAYSSRGLTPGGNPYFDRHISHPLQMKAQPWVAVGQGATGLFVYFYKIYKDRDLGEFTAFKTETGDDTPAYAAWAEALAEIRPYAPLLLKLQRQEETVASSGDDRVWITTFRARPGESLPGVYLVAVNADWEKARTFSLTCSLPGDIIDVAGGKRIGTEEQKALTIGPGSGRIFHVAP